MKTIYNYPHKGVGSNWRTSGFFSFLAFLMCFTFSSHAQTTYTGDNLGAAVGPDAGTVTESVATSTLTGTIGTDYIISNVTLDITHTWVSDLDISLVAPDGTSLDLSSDNGGSGDNYTNTQFEDDGPDGDIILGSAPFTGVFTPEDATFADAFDGVDVNGSWTLVIFDDADGDGGMFNNFEITFSPPPTCDKPDNLTASDITLMGAELSWDDVPTASLGYQWVVMPSGIPPAADGSEAATGTTNSGELMATVSGLSGGAAYDAYVRSVCSIVDSSDWSDAVSFSTPPANDNFEDAIPAVCDGNYTGSTVGATPDVAPSSNVWYSFTGSGTAEIVTLDLCDSDYDTRLRVYTGTAGDLTQIAVNDDFCDFQSQLTFDSDGSTTYYISVGAFGSNTGNYDLDVTCVDAPSCIAPENLSVANVTLSGAELSWDDEITATLGYQWVVMPSGVEPIVDGSEVATGTTNPGELMATVSGLSAGTPYDAYVRSVCSIVDSSDWSEETSFSTPPANDNFDDAVPAACGGNYTGTTVGATPDVAPSSNVWYSFTGSGTAEIVTLDLCDSDYDTRLRVYTGTAGDLTQIAVNDDFCDFQSQLTFDSDGSTTYYISVGAFGSNTGNYDLDVTCVDAPSCIAPENLSVTNVTLSGAELSWDDEITATLGYQWVVMPSGVEPIVDGSEVATGTTNPGELMATVSGLSAGTPYDAYVRSVCSIVDSSDWSNVSSFLTLPANDNFDDAIPVACDGNYTGSTDGATFDEGSSAPNVWYSFTGAGNAELVTLDLCDSDYDTRLRVYTGTAGDLTQIGTNDDSCGLQSQLSFSSDGSTTYYISVEGFDATDTGNYDLDVTCIAPIANDNFADAIPVACGGNYTGSTDGATFDEGSSAPNVWYSYTGTGIPEVVNLDLCDSDYDTRIRVYTGTSGDLTQIGTNDDSCGLQSQLSFDSDGLTTYYISIEGFAATSIGDYDLDVSCLATLAFQDIFTDRGIVSGAVAFNDVDLDGDQDVFISGALNVSSTGIAGPGVSRMYLNDGAGSFTHDVGNSFSALAHSSVSFYDINDDNVMDILLSGELIQFGNNVNKFYTNDGSGDFTTTTNFALPRIDRKDFKFADLNGDSNDDLLIIGEDRFNGQPITKIFTSQNNAINSNLPKVLKGSIDVADIDGDSDLDIFISGDLNGTKISRLYKNEGNYQFSLVAGTSFDGVDDGDSGFADVDDDGDQDLLISGLDSSMNNVLKLYLNDGTGSFNEAAGIFSLSPNILIDAFDIADIDGDNDLDIFMTGYNTTNFRTVTKIWENLLYANRAPENTSVFDFGDDNDFGIGFKLFPNPTDRGYFNIYAPNVEGEVMINITDISGRNVMSQNLTISNNSLTINSENLSTGIYIVRLSAGEQSFTSKLIVK